MVEGIRDVGGLGLRGVGVGHSRETLGLETLGLGIRVHSGVGHSWRLWGWALRRHSGVGHSRETTRGWAPQEHSGVGHSRDTLGLGIPGTGRGGEEKSSGRGEELS